MLATVNRSRARGFSRVHAYAATPGNGARPRNGCPTITRLHRKTVGDIRISPSGLRVIRQRGLAARRCRADEGNLERVQPVSPGPRFAVSISQMINPSVKTSGPGEDSLCTRLFLAPPLSCWLHSAAGLKGPLGFLWREMCTVNAAGLEVSVIKSPVVDEKKHVCHYRDRSDKESDSPRSWSYAAAVHSNSVIMR
ncbi:unnamed protein product [Merluccius merluccius]